MLAACHKERCQRCAESSHNESDSAYPAGGNRPRTAGKEYTESESLGVVFAHFLFAKEIRSNPLTSTLASNFDSLIRISDLLFFGQKRFEVREPNPNFNTFLT